MSLSRARSKPTIRDFIADDARVVAVEGFRPMMGQMVERGQFFRLDSPIVRQWPMYFVVAVPVTDVLSEIERDGKEAA
jgi:hypothetical protein